MTIRHYCERCGNEITEMLNQTSNQEHTVWIGRRRSATCCQACCDLLNALLDNRVLIAAAVLPDRHPPRLSWWRRLASCALGDTRPGGPVA